MDGEEEEEYALTVTGIICVDDGIIRLKNRCQLDDCSICYEPSTTHGEHQICCLPCGHMYGFSCIKQWLLLSSSSGKCPQCKTCCSIQDARLLYPPHLCATDHQEVVDALRRQMDALKQRSDAFDSRMKLYEEEHRKREEEIAKAERDLKQRSDVLKQRSDALKQRSDAFRKREEEIAKAKRDFERKKKLAEEEAEKEAEKKLKDKEKKMQASGTIDVPEERMVEDAKTTERVRVSSKRKRGNGPDSISKVILKRKKSNNYMYYRALWNAAVLTVALAVSFCFF